MRITVLSGGFAMVGGIESFVFDLLSEVSARGIESQMYCWDASGLTCNPMLRQLAGQGVRIHRSSWHWGCRWAWPDKLLLATAGEALLDTDLVVFGKPLSAAIHRKLVDRRGPNGSPRFLLITPYRPAEMWPAAPDSELLGSFDGIAVQANSFSADLQNLGYRGPVTVLPYIPPHCTRPTALPFGTLRIGFLGRLVGDKNLPYLLHAFRAVLLRQPAILSLYGDGPLAGELRDLALRLGIASSVRFCGWLTPADVPAAIDSCSVFAFTSSTEGQCLAALEILARGRTIVATPVGAFTEMLDDAGLGSIGDASNAEAFARKLIDVAAQRLAPEKVQQAYASKFNRGAVIDGYLALFRQMSGC